MNDPISDGLKKAHTELLRIAEFLEKVAEDHRQFVKLRQEMEFLFSNMQDDLFYTKHNSVFEVLQERVYEVLKRQPMPPKEIYRAIDGDNLPVEIRQLRNWLSRELRKGKLTRRDGHYMIA